MPDDVPQNVTRRTIGQYLDALASSDPMPGGGSASGIVGALGSSLGLMALALTDIDASDVADELRAAQANLESLRDRFTELSRQDEEAYLGYLGATRLPKRSDEEKSVRRVAMQDALKHAASVPLALCEASVELAEAIAPVSEHGNRHLKSDARVAAIFAGACFTAARGLVDTNLDLIKDADWVEDVTAHLDDLAQRITSTATHT
jgi:formiminotetrahydrofolate cyclodeaminase